jgi:hypothetical protein
VGGVAGKNDEALTSLGLSGRAVALDIVGIFGGSALEPISDN